MGKSLHKNYLLIDGVGGKGGESIAWELTTKGWYIPKNNIEEIPEHPYTGSYFSFRIGKGVNKELEKGFLIGEYPVGTFRFNLLHKKWYDRNDAFGTSSLGDGFRSRLDLAFGTSFLSSYKKCVNKSTELRSPEIRESLADILEK